MIWGAAIGSPAVVGSPVAGIEFPEGLFLGLFGLLGSVAGIVTPDDGDFTLGPACRSVFSNRRIFRTLLFPSVPFSRYGILIWRRLMAPARSRRTMVIWSEWEAVGNSQQVGKNATVLEMR